MKQTFRSLKRVEFKLSSFWYLTHNFESYFMFKHMKTFNKHCSWLHNDNNTRALEIEIAEDYNVTTMQSHQRRVFFLVIFLAHWKSYIINVTFVFCIIILTVCRIYGNDMFWHKRCIRRYLFSYIDLRKVKVSARELIFNFREIEFNGIDFRPIENILFL